NSTPGSQAGSEFNFSEPQNLLRRAARCVVDCLTGHDCAGPLRDLTSLPRGENIAGAKLPGPGTMEEGPQKSGATGRFGGPRNLTVTPEAGRVHSYPPHFVP